MAAQQTLKPWALLPGARTSGFVGTLAGVLFAGMLVWEYAADLHPGSGPMAGQRLVNQAGFLIAMIGYLVMLIGVHRSRVAGPGKLGRVATGIFVAAWALLVLGSLLTVVGVSQDSNPLLPIGGLLQTIGGLLVGVVAARFGPWRGWQRWWPLAVGVYWLSALFLPVFFGQEPTLLTEMGWAASYAVLGIALSTASSATPPRENGTPSATPNQAA